MPAVLAVAKGLEAPLCVALLVVCSSTLLGLSSLSLAIPSAEKGYVTYYPTGALDYIQKHYATGNVLTEFGWGEYLIWNLGPEMKVALDGRYETVYEDRVANEYFDYMNGKDNGFLGAYAHDFILFRPDSPPVVSLRSNPDWKAVYEDVGSVLFAKQ